MLRAFLLAVLVAAAPHAQTTTGAPLDPNRAISRLDFHLTAGVGVLGSDTTPVGEAEAALMVESPALGPLVAQVGGAFGFGTGSEEVEILPGGAVGARGEVYKMTAGIGLVNRDAPVRSWVMANVWVQSYGRSTSPAASLGAGLDTNPDGRLGLSVGVRVLVGDARAPEGDLGLLATARAGLAIHF